MPCKFVWQTISIFIILEIFHDKCFVLASQSCRWVGGITLEETASSYEVISPDWLHSLRLSPIYIHSLTVNLLSVTLSETKIGIGSFVENVCFLLILLTQWKRVGVDWIVYVYCLMSILYSVTCCIHYQLNIILWGCYRDCVLGIVWLMAVFFYPAGKSPALFPWFVLGIF